MREALRNSFYPPKRGEGTVPGGATEDQGYAHHPDGQGRYRM